MAAIKPFRYLIVYPALMRSIESYWQNRKASPGYSGTRRSSRRRTPPSAMRA
jgi:hypothetical protein